MEDSAIIDRLFRRDDSALEALEEQYGLRLLRLAGRFLRSREDAEEAVNDTWLTCWNTIPPQRPGHLFAYLARCCRFAALNRVDWLTAQKRRATVVELTQELEQCIPDPAWEQGAAEAELGEVLNTFLAGLPAEKRKMFLRRYWYGQSVREVARGLGVGESKVKTTLFRLREELRNHLKEEGISI